MIENVFRHTDFDFANFGHIDNHQSYICILLKQKYTLSIDVETQIKYELFTKPTQIGVGMWGGGECWYVIRNSPVYCQCLYLEKL